MLNWHSFVILTVWDTHKKYEKKFFVHYKYYIFCIEFEREQACKNVFSGKMPKNMPSDEFVDDKKDKSSLGDVVVS